MLSTRITDTYALKVKEVITTAESVTDLITELQEFDTTYQNARLLVALKMTVLTQALTQLQLPVIKAAFIALGGRYEQD